MGWAKYAEDNYEIHLERIYYQSEKAQETRFQITTVIPSVVPAKVEISVQSSKVPECKDRTIECCDCGKRFLFTTGEQKFFASHQLHTPKRCKACRQINKKKAERDHPKYCVNLRYGVE